MTKEGPRQNIRARVDSAPTPDETSARKLFSEMTPKDKVGFLNQMKEKFDQKQLIKMYGLSDEEVELYFGANKSREKLTPDTELLRPITAENVHVVSTELEYPAHAKSQRSWNPEVAAFIQSVCSLADYNKKPYAQINFSNGTALFEYTKKADKYTPTLVTHPDAANDFE